MGTGRAVALCSIVAFSLAGCARGGDAKPDSTVLASPSVPAPNPDAPVMLRGTVASVAADTLVLQSDSGRVTVKLAQPFSVYARTPSSLAEVKDSSFIGVTTVKQPDGSERATEIHVFPETLRGLGEGSRMMTADTSAAASRMTNGNVTASRMTNGSVSPSRMSNGSVSRQDGSTLVVQYSGGSQTVTVPPNTPVTTFRIMSTPLAVGDKVTLMGKKSPDGSFTAAQAIAMAK